MFYQIFTPNLSPHCLNEATECFLKRQAGGLTPLQTVRGLLRGDSLQLEEEIQKNRLTALNNMILKVIDWVIFIRRSILFIASWHIELTVTLHLFFPSPVIKIQIDHCTFKDLGQSHTWIEILWPLCFLSHKTIFEVYCYQNGLSFQLESVAETYHVLRLDSNLLAKHIHLEVNNDHFDLLCPLYPELVQFKWTVLKECKRLNEILPTIHYCYVA